MRKYDGYILFILLMVFTSIATGVEQPQQKTKTIHPIYAEQPPEIDGVLDDEVWQTEPTIDDNFLTFRPSQGALLSKKTRVWIAYDPENLYIAFYSHDDNPEKIKTSVAKRDSAFYDDWVGIAIDMTGKRQSLYELIVNPNGVQADLLNSTSGGETMEPDWVWYSAGRVVEDGYIVEMHLPFKNFSYTSGKNVEMYITLIRDVPSLGVGASWPQLDVSKGMFDSTAKMIVPEVEENTIKEFIPELTYSSFWDRVSPDEWTDADDLLDFGITGTYGITSSLKLDATINPDFSQIESDTFQIVTNQRYPIFYREKRPFFMEASDNFDLSGSSDNMYLPVHTRTIVDPDWGARLTGNIGDFTIGILAASDAWPGRELEDEVNTYLGDNANFYIGRIKYNLGSNNYAGVLFTDRSFNGAYNRSVAADLKLKLADSHFTEFSYIHTFTNDPENGGEFDGGALAANYSYSTSSTWFEIEYEYYDNDFRMDTAFYRRTGFHKVDANLDLYFYPQKERDNPWLHRISPQVWYRYLHDIETGLDDECFEIELNVQTILKGSFTIEYTPIDREGWAGQVFEKDGWFFYMQIQPFTWLNFSSYLLLGKHIYYDPDDPFLGNRTEYQLQFDLQPTDNLNQFILYTNTKFNKLDSDENVYDVHILTSKTTYQFNKYLFVRALIQWDSYREIVLTDILASFTLIPGTVLHVGYGSLHNKIGYDPVNSRWSDEMNGAEYYRLSQSLFLKAGYRFQF